MRLDHLLSKEQPTRLVGWVMVARVARVWWRGAQLAETLASSRWIPFFVCLVLPCCGVWKDRGGVWLGGQASCWVLKQQTVWPVRVGVWCFGGCPAWSSYRLGFRVLVAVVVWGCALFENYTVDASIFVVKLLRADGGCLGTRSR